LFDAFKATRLKDIKLMWLDEAMLTFSKKQLSLKHERYFVPGLKCIRTMGFVDEHRDLPRSPSLPGALREEIKSLASFRRLNSSLEYFLISGSST